MQHLGSRSRPKDVVSQEQLAALGQVFRVENIPSASVGQTSYAVPNGYTAGAVMVFLNGVLLQPTDYTAADGTNVVLAKASTQISDTVSVVVLSAIRAQDDALLQSTVAALPPAASSLAKVRYCTNMAGRAAPVYSDGTNWRRMGDDSIVTT